MKITYTPNPLNTIIELDDQEKEIFRLKLKNEELINRLFDAHYEFAYKKDPDIDAVKKAVDAKYYMSEGEEICPLDVRVNELLEHYLEELQLAHVGDCTSFPMSCSKCHAEDLLGLNTIKGLGKGSANYIDRAFRNCDGTLDEAIKWLETHEIQPDTKSNIWMKIGGWTQHMVRWKSNLEAATTWLIKYRDTNFKGSAQ